MSFESSKIITYPNTIFKLEYRIDEEGNVWTPFRGWSLMSPKTNRCGYRELSLRTTEKNMKRYFKVHRLVMETFNPIKNSSELQVNHIDGNKQNNHLKNLEWCTRSENVKHAFRIGLENNNGENNPSHKLTENDVINICERLCNGETLQKIANDYNVSKGCIAHIRQKRTWKNITENYNFC